MNRSELFHHLKKFNLDINQIETYLALLKKNQSTVVQLSQQTGINRTTLYRVLSELEENGLVEHIIQQHTSLYTARSIDNLNVSIIQKEEEIKDLKHTLGILGNEKQLLQPSAYKATKIVHFKGAEGIKQLLWNTLNIGKNGQLVGFSFLNLNVGIGKHFAESLRQEYIDKNIQWRELQNTDQVEKEEDFTDLAKQYKKTVYSSRAIPQSVVPIRHNTFIYNDVMAYYHHYNDELFGVEIHNATIAQTQKAIFEVLWGMGVAIEDILRGN